jgi:hypothetical protein
MKLRQALDSSRRAPSRNAGGYYYTGGNRCVTPSFSYAYSQQQQQPTQMRIATPSQYSTHMNMHTPIVNDPRFLSQEAAYPNNMGPYIDNNDFMQQQAPLNSSFDYQGPANGYIEPTLAGGSYILDMDNSFVEPSMLPYSSSGLEQQQGFLNGQLLQQQQQQQPQQPAQSSIIQQMTVPPSAYTSSTSSTNQHSAFQLTTNLGSANSLAYKGSILQQQPQQQQQPTTLPINNLTSQQQQQQMSMSSQQTQQQLKEEGRRPSTSSLNGK